MPEYLKVTVTTESPLGEVVTWVMPKVANFGWGVAMDSTRRPAFYGVPSAHTGDIEQLAFTMRPERDDPAGVAFTQTVRQETT